VIRGAAISDSVKYWIKPNIENRIKNGEVKAYFHSIVREVRPYEVTLSTPEGEVTLKNDYVLAMVGYRPDFEFMAKHGVHLDPATNRPLLNTDTLESERKGFYLAGVIVAGTHTNEIFIENGRFHGKLIAEAVEKALQSKRAVA
jgi:thioredoxin reductase (NADPH)